MHDIVFYTVFYDYKILHDMYSMVGHLHMRLYFVDILLFSLFCHLAALQFIGKL